MAEVGIRTPGRGFGPYNGVANFPLPLAKVLYGANAFEISNIQESETPCSS